MGELYAARHLLVTVEVQDTETAKEMIVVVMVDSAQAVSRHGEASRCPLEGTLRTRVIGAGRPAAEKTS